MIKHHVCSNTSTICGDIADVTFRSLPNWKNMKDDVGEDQQQPMSEEDMRVMNSKESSILTSNLASTEALIPDTEIISDVGQLRTLGNLTESLVSGEACEETSGWEGLIEKLVSEVDERVWFMEKVMSKRGSQRGL